MAFHMSLLCFVDFLIGLSSLDWEDSEEMRATISFGLAGGTLAISAFLLFPAVLFLFPIAGVAASLLIHQGTKSAGQRIVAGTMTAAAFGFTGWIVFFSLISLQADVEPLWGAFAWGLGFGVAGAISGQSLSRLWRPGSQESATIPFAGLIAGVVFMLSGAVAGFLAFLEFPKWNVASLVVCIWLAFQLGGVGCDVGWRLLLKQNNSKIS